MLTLARQAGKLTSVAKRLCEEMAVVDEKLICRLCAEVKEFCVDIFGEDGVKTACRKKIGLYLSNCKYYSTFIVCIHVTIRGCQNYKKS